MAFLGESILPVTLAPAPISFTTKDTKGHEESGFFFLGPRTKAQDPKT
jgi:hypothetical protein